ncbi:MAG: hypothetical protein ACTSQG_00625 [Promethearchaeota archaeon]
MEKTINLVEFIKDEFVPEPKQIPERIKKEVKLDLEIIFCPFCGHPLEYHYLSHPRLLITLKYDVSLRVVYKRCANEECDACISKRKFYNLSLDLYAIPKKAYAMDVILLIGHLIQQEHYTEERVVKYLLEEHGITISQPSVNNYKRIALALGEALIMGNEEKVKSGLDELAFRVYSIDGLSSNRSRTLFVIRDLISGIVLGSALLDKHDADAMHDFMEAVFQKFGAPDYMVGDGERGLIGAVREYYPDIPYHYCHRHFLNNMGKALMEDLYKAAKKTSIEKML